LTTAASIFAVAAIGVVLGYGHLALGAITAAGILIVLELPYVPWLRGIDAEVFTKRFRKDPQFGGPAKDQQRPFQEKATRGP
jgi:hypothetical protein